MRVLMVNKFLYPNGGSETYMLRLGKYLEEIGHRVQYFGMEHQNRCVGNNVNAYTSEMDFRGDGKLSKLIYPIKTIYSREARIQIRKVLDDFKPDICHLNNFNYQLTPSIILEIIKWRKKNNITCRIIYTAHDYQLVCPNHMFYNLSQHKNCEKCLNGNFLNCIKGKCIHGSTAKSIVGAIEAYFWKIKGTYKYIDVIICPSRFVKGKLDSNPLFKKKTVTMHNFIERKDTKIDELYDKNVELPQKYVLYFGRYSGEKGIHTLIEAAKNLSDIKFVFAGNGPLSGLISSQPNIINMGFQTGDRLDRLIKNAAFCVCPSEWYEVYGLTNAEAINMGTPVIASNIGGIPEVVKNNDTGKLFQAGNIKNLIIIIQELINNQEELERLRDNCNRSNKIYIDKYTEDLCEIYIFPN